MKEVTFHEFDLETSLIEFEVFLSFSLYSHKSPNVRKATAMHLDRLVEKMGPGRVLSGVKDITDKILPTAARLAVDNAQETRYDLRRTGTILFLR